MINHLIVLWSIIYLMKWAIRRFAVSIKSWTLVDAIDSDVNLKYAFISYESKLSRGYFMNFHIALSPYKEYLRMFYTTGIFFIALGNVMAPLFLLHCIFLILGDYSTIFIPPTDEADAPDLLEPTNIVTPIIPGLNFPWKYAWEYWVCVLFVVCTHEIGHALAALTENVHISSIGVFFAGAMPGAFVTIDEHALKLSSLGSKLRIIAGGILHNITFGAICYLLLCSLPWVLRWTMLIRVDGAVVTLPLPSTNPFSETLRLGDIIIAVNECSVTSPFSLRSDKPCLPVLPTKGTLTRRDVDIPPEVTDYLLHRFQSLSIVGNDSYEPLDSTGTSGKGRVSTILDNGDRNSKGVMATSGGSGILGSGSNIRGGIVTSTTTLASLGSTSSSTTTASSSTSSTSSMASPEASSTSNGDSATSPIGANSGSSSSGGRRALTSTSSMSSHQVASRSASAHPLTHLNIGLCHRSNSVPAKTSGGGSGATDQTQPTLHTNARTDNSSTIISVANKTASAAIPLGPSSPLVGIWGDSPQRSLHCCSQRIYGLTSDMLTSSTACVMYSMTHNTADVIDHVRTYDSLEQDVSLEMACVEDGHSSSTSIATSGNHKGHDHDYNDMKVADSDLSGLSPLQRVRDRVLSKDFKYCYSNNDCMQYENNVPSPNQLLCFRPLSEVHVARIHFHVLRNVNNIKDNDNNDVSDKHSTTHAIANHDGESTVPHLRYVTVSVEMDPKYIEDDLLAYLGEYTLSPSWVLFLERTLGPSWAVAWQSRLLAIPDSLVLYLWLLTQMSFSVAIVNTLPVVSLDGSHSVTLLLEVLSPKYGSQLSAVTIRMFTMSMVAIMVLASIPIFQREFQDHLMT